MPKISVIMGVYNVGDENKLFESVESILNQTYTDFELIICDDGSTNDSYKYISELKKKDSRIKILSHKENKGLSISLNSCIDVAEGEFIARQDDDDLSRNDRLQIQLDFLQNHKEYSFVGSSIWLFDENSCWGKHDYPLCPQKRDFLWGSPFSHGSIMFRKEALIKNDFYRYANETRRCEDYDLFMRMYSNSCIAYNLEDRLYFYREDAQAAYRRKYKYRIDEFKVRMKGFTSLGLMPIGIIFAVKPLLVGLIPMHTINIIKNSVYKRKL